MRAPAAAASSAASALSSAGARMSSSSCASAAADRVLAVGRAAVAEQDGHPARRPRRRELIGRRAQRGRDRGHAVPAQAEQPVDDVAGRGRAGHRPLHGDRAREAQHRVLRRRPPRARRGRHAPRWPAGRRSSSRTRRPAGTARDRAVPSRAPPVRRAPGGRPSARAPAMPSIDRSTSRSPPTVGRHAAQPGGAAAPRPPGPRDVEQQSCRPTGAPRSRSRSSVATVRSASSSSAGAGVRRAAPPRARPRRVRRPAARPRRTARGAGCRSARDDGARARRPRRRYGLAARSLAGWRFPRRVTARSRCCRPRRTAAARTPPRTARARRPRPGGRHDSCSRIRPDSATSAASRPTCQSVGSVPRAPRPASVASRVRSIAPRTDEPIRTSGCVAGAPGQLDDLRPATRPAPAGACRSTIDALVRRRSGSPSRCGRCGRTPPPRCAPCRPRRTGSSPRPAGIPLPASTWPSRGTCSSPSLITVMRTLSVSSGHPVELLDVEQAAGAQRRDQRAVDEDLLDVAVGEHPGRVEVADQPRRGQLGVALDEEERHVLRRPRRRAAACSCRCPAVLRARRARRCRAPRAAARPPARGRPASSCTVNRLAITLRARGPPRRGRSCRRAGRRSPR